MIGTATHVGNVRVNNEDTYRVLHVRRAHVLVGVVADGMGGHAAGEVASRIAVVRSCASLQHALRRKEDANVGELMLRAFTIANKAICKAVADNPDCSGMGTTMTMACFQGDTLVLGHVGDSRAYLLRDGVWRRLTKDHSFVQELVDAGKITDEEAAKHPQRNIITRALGTQESVPIDIDVLSWQKGDKLLLCTDGAHDMINDTLLKTCVQDNDPQEGADAIVAEALNAGGRDNITAIIISNETDEKEAVEK